MLIWIEERSTISAHALRENLGKSFFLMDRCKTTLGGLTYQVIIIIFLAKTYQVIWEASPCIDFHFLVGYYRNNFEIIC